MRSQTMWGIFDLSMIRAMLVFVPADAELPQPRGHSTADRERMIARFPHDADRWRAFYARPTTWDHVRARLAAEAEQPAAVHG